MRHQLLLLTILLSCGLIASAQKEWDGLLTTVEHPTVQARERVLAIMIDDAYIPIQIKEGVYATVANPQSNTQTLSGKPIQLDSIYHFVCRQDEDVYSYDFEQLHKGAKYVTVEGCFVNETMGPSEPGGEPLPGFFFYFLTTTGQEMGLASFSGRSEAANTLGGWGLAHSYGKNWYDSSVSPDTVYTVRFLKLETGYYRGRYIPTHLLKSKPVAVQQMGDVNRPQIEVERGKLLINSERPMTCILLSNITGYTKAYDINNPQEFVLSPPYPNQPYVIHIEFADGSTPFTQKILL
ncbi:hypothetical protein [uncultured Porphyromonas sp.]|uniref:hypothetical protein n=1 Tax=uncultured Porphyromonas sp. TaxID=159274 RepID=UPI002621C599|nr:hypothetical protein [uncultured Porphyromonas sp.]